MGVVDPIGEAPRFGGTTSAWQPSSGVGKGIPLEASQVEGPAQPQVEVTVVEVEAVP